MRSREPDAVLIPRARAGDGEAFAALYLRHHEAVAQVCRKRLGDPQLAEDATQETFLRAWKALPSFHHEADLTHWLRRIASNHCHDLWRSSERGRFVAAGTELPVDVADPSAEEAVNAAADRLAVRALLQRLRPRDAELLVDHHAAGIPVRALAQRWRMTTGAMEVALHRARQRARRGAEQQGLRGLVPLDALRRLAVWLQRSITDMGGVSSPAAAALCNLAVVAAAAVMPNMLPSAPSGAAIVREPARVLVQVDASSRTASRLPHSSGAVREATAGPRRAASRSASSSPPAEQQQQSRLVEFDPVPVPIAGGHLRSEADEDWVRTRRYGVRNPATGGNLVGTTEHENDPDPSHRVGERACRVAAAGEPVTYCD